MQGATRYRHTERVEVVRFELQVLPSVTGARSRPEGGRVSRRVASTCGCRAYKYARTSLRFGGSIT